MLEGGRASQGDLVGPLGDRPSTVAPGPGRETGERERLVALDLLADLLGDARIPQRRRVAEILVVGDVLEQPSHDLARTRLREVLTEGDGVGPGEGADLVSIKS